MPIVGTDIGLMAALVEDCQVPFNVVEFSSNNRDVRGPAKKDVDMVRSRWSEGLEQRV